MPKARQDGIEAIRRLELADRPDKKAAIDRLYGQTKARAAAHGFARNVPPDTITDENGAEVPNPIAYPEVDGTLPALVDGLAALREDVAGLRAEVAELRSSLATRPAADDAAVAELRREVEELKLRPFA
ncbi:MAG TPA: hypothetical protein VLB86_03990 [Gaiellaceae bacterium]|nr:hypothetical protein [Gaiellaceae bacterium]